MLFVLNVLKIKHTQKLVPDSGKNRINALPKFIT